VISRSGVAPSPGARRVLFVSPSELSSGEGIKVLHMAEQLQRAGGTVACLASAFTARFLAPRLGTAVHPLTEDVAENNRRWQGVLASVRPQVVVFADYPLLFFSNGIAPLVTDSWLAALPEIDAALVTLDHLGYAQRAQRVSYGPPHLSLHSECTPDLPRGMAVLRPCPMNAPAMDPARIGAPFRFLDLPLVTRVGSGAEAHVRAGGRASHLVVHVTPNWAWRMAEDWRLPHYAMLPAVLETLFRDVERPVRVISINNGGLLMECDSDRLSIRNSGVMPRDEYEALLASADLLLTDNAVSATIGRAICSGIPAIALRNRRRLPEILGAGDPSARALADAMETARPGAVFPFEVFPLWNALDVDALGLFHGNAVTDAFVPVELFGGAESAETVRGVLEDGDVRARLGERQAHYTERVAALRTTPEALSDVVGVPMPGA
jgi:hypothetical protein